MTDKAVLQKVGEFKPITRKGNMQNDLFSNIDQYVQRVSANFEAVGVAVGIVRDDRLVFSTEYGLRDHESHLPMTRSTLVPIASNTKLFTSIAAGLLVEQGQLTYDDPIRDFVPQLRFSSRELDAAVTLRDMLSHRTGLEAADMIRHRSGLSSQALFEKVRYLKAIAPMRTIFDYNNILYEAVGYVIELLSGMEYSDFVRKKLLEPLSMHASTFSYGAMQENLDFAFPYAKDRPSGRLLRIPYDLSDSFACGGLVSNIEEMSHWLVALMNEGYFEGNSVIPKAVLDAALQPAFAHKTRSLNQRTSWELSGATEGLGRYLVGFHGHLMVSHSGAKEGYSSEVSYLPRHKVGVCVLVLGDHCRGLEQAISYGVFEQLLDLPTSPWADRLSEALGAESMRIDQSIESANEGRVNATHTSHQLGDYVGRFQHNAYGDMVIELDGNELQFRFRHWRLPLFHFHYDRFDSRFDPIVGRWSVNFLTGPDGGLDRLETFLDGSDILFRRAAESSH